MIVQGAMRVTLLLFSPTTRGAAAGSASRKVGIFCAALGMNIDVLLGNSPPPPIVDIYRISHKDMWRKGQWKMDWIALPIYHLAKFVHKCVQEQSRTHSRVDSRIKALIVMYQYFQDEVTRVGTNANQRLSHRKRHGKKVIKEITSQWFQVWPQDGESTMAWQWLGNGSTG